MHYKYPLMLLACLSEFACVTVWFYIWVSYFLHTAPPNVQSVPFILFPAHIQRKEALQPTFSFKCIYVRREIHVEFKKTYELYAEHVRTLYSLHSVSPCNVHHMHGGIVDEN